MRKKNPAASDEPRIIKKYLNRRLYDSDRRTYITLNDIKQYVIDGTEFRVIDAQTKADITKATLLQIIIEQEEGTGAFFTTPLLQQMIRLHHDNMQKMFSEYFEQAMGQFEKFQKMNPFMEWLKK